MSMSQSTPRLLPVSSDVAGGTVIALLALLQIALVSTGGLLAFAVLLVVWPLVGGATAAFFSGRARDRALDGAVAGTFAALAATLLVLLSGFAGAWPAFITANIGVSLWPVTFTTMIGATLSWTVFGYLGGTLAGKLA